ncbi:hypothetical protein WI23_15260 [Burkholderia oklahomensis C6786]|nr:hypothetical protein WI23_15260 [Burkholderia oklahomensis C6786]KUY59905.1 hypothetical protein WI23_15015 [Burkholderia oklahomensis C6786]
MRCAHVGFGRKPARAPGVVESTSVRFRPHLGAIPQFRDSAIPRFRDSAIPQFRNSATPRRNRSQGRRRATVALRHRASTSRFDIALRRDSPDIAKRRARAR